MLRPLLTHEIGSLAKPRWRVRAVAGLPVDAADVEDARIWGERLGVPGHESLLELLTQHPLPPEGRDEVRQWSSWYATALCESAGLDVVYDGEQRRSEMYGWAVEHADGFETRGSVRSFDDKYYSKAAVTGPVSLRVPYHNEEFAFARRHADAELKIPVTGAYTLAAWSYNEYYQPGTDLTRPAAVRRRERQDARRRFALACARDLVRPNIEALIAIGARWIQVDEPAGSTDPAEVALMAETFNTCVAGLDATFTTHLCFSDYDLFFPAIEQMEACQQYAVGFANYDSRQLGVSDAARPGYRTIGKFRDLPYKPGLGLGVLDIHTDFVEPPELVRDRILYAAEVFGGPERIQVTPDCGLRTRSWEVAHAKLAAMVDGVELAKAHLGL